MSHHFGDIAQVSASDWSRASWQPSRAKLRRRLHLSMLALDALCIFSAFFLASLIYEPRTAEGQWLLVASTLTPVYLLIALSLHAYSSDVVREPWRGVARALHAFALAGGTIMLGAFYLKTEADFSRLTFALGTMFSFLFLAISRETVLRKVKQIFGGNPYAVVLISDGSMPISQSGFSQVLSADTLFDPDCSSPEKFDQLAAELKDADRVVVSCSPERRDGWVQMLKGANIQSEIVAMELAPLAPLGMAKWGNTPTVVVADGPLSKFDALAKRLFDIGVAGASLLVLAPALLLVALLIKLESEGPVFFIQKRIGQGNRQFRMFKFRSMRADRLDHSGNTSASRDDDRITRVGKFIRSTSIDELPQLINVLLGDMSIVGPRPHAIGSRAEDKLFWEIDRRYWHRHAAKPGLTGLAQVRGFRGATIREQDLTDRLQADLEYLNDWSIWRDLKIIAMTFKVLVHKNAF